MPSADLIREFIDDSKKRFERLESKVDRQFIVGLLVIGALLGPHLYKAIPQIFEIAASFAAGVK